MKTMDFETQAKVIAHPTLIKLRTDREAVAARKTSTLTLTLPLLLSCLTVGLVASVVVMLANAIRQVIQF